METVAAITTGPAGQVWLAGGADNEVGRVNTTTGAVTHFTTTGISVNDITLGPDGNMWFVGRDAGTVGKVNPTTGAVTPFTPPTLGAPAVIARGPDGHLWAASSFEGVGDRLQRVTTAGAATDFPASGLDRPVGITVGPDGNIWAAAFAANAVVRTTPAGRMRSTPVPGISGAHSVAAGPDGNIWVTGRTNDTVARVNPTTGASTVFPTAPVDNPRGIVAGPDGNLWLVGHNSDSVGRVNPVTGGVTSFPATGVDQPREITVGPDGNLWVTGSGNDTVGRVVPATGAVTAFPTTGINQPFDIATGPDDNLWVTGFGSGSVGRITPAGVVTVFPVGPVSPTGIDAGPDGNLWFVAQSTDSMGRLTPFGGLSTFFTPSDAGVDGPGFITRGPDQPAGTGADPGGRLWITGELNDSLASVRTFGRHGFTDVAPTAFFQDGVEWAGAFALVSGFPGNRYLPQNAVKRGQIANMLFQLMDAPTGSPPHAFADVDPGAFFGDGLDWAKAQGLVSGFPGNRYKPQDAVNRGQLVNMVWNMVGRPAGSPPHGFGDVAADAFFADALDWAKAEGLVSGFPGNTYRPRDPVKRGQVASILYNLARNPDAWVAFAGPPPSTVLFD